MPFFVNLKKALNIGSAAAESKKRKALFANIKTDINPEDEWDLICEIGDGAFGKVHKARSKENPDLLAAAKICILENENDLEDFMVEINILGEVEDDNIIKLLEAFYYDDKLWVSGIYSWVNYSQMYIKLIGIFEPMLIWSLALLFLSQVSCVTFLVLIIYESFRKILRTHCINKY